MGRFSKIGKGAILLGVSSLLSRLLGIYRDHLFANIFGAGKLIGIFDLDTYYAAFRIPDFLYNLLIYGTISVAFIPILTVYFKKKQEKEGWEFAGTVLNLLLILLLGVSFLVFIFAPYLVKVVVPGFTGEKLEITIKLTRIMLISPIFFGLSSIFQGIQNTFKSFFYFSLAPIFYNLSIIFSVLFLSERYGVYGITWGVILGAFLHFAVQCPKVFKLGFRFKWAFDYQREDVRKMARLVLPVIVGISVTQINLLVTTLIGSTLAAGSITIINYAFNLNSLPLGIIGISLAVAAFSTLSELAVEEDSKQFVQELKKRINQILFLIIPSMMGLFLLRFEIVSLILKGGEFGLKETVLTANTLAFLVIGLFAQSLIPLLARAFFAYHNTKTPVLIGVWAVVFNIAGSLFFTRVFNWGVYGLALAGSLASILNCAMCLMALRQKLWTKEAILDWRKMGKFVLSTLLMAGLVWGVREGFVYFWGEIQTFAQFALQIGAAVGGGGLFYLGITYLLKCEEARRFLKS